MPASLASSDNERDELMEDADDAQHDRELDLNEDEDNEMDVDDEEDVIDDEDDEDQPLQTRSHQSMGPPTTQSNSDDNTTHITGDSTLSLGEVSFDQDQRKDDYRKRLLACLNPVMRSSALSAGSYDIVPTIASPHATSINAITASPDFRYWFTGGSDGYIRKFDGPATVNGRSQLTVAQRHPFVESVTKAGVTMTYWENLEKRARLGGDEPEASVVYSLAVARDSLWLLSGQHSGGIRMQTVRHNCGESINFFEKHTSAVSVLALSHDEKTLLSGSWDKSVLDWDLTTGLSTRTFHLPGQISAIQTRPESSLSVPEELGELPIVSQTMSDNNGAQVVTNGITTAIGVRNGTVGAIGSDKVTPLEEADSLFGDVEKDSLFGEDDEAAPSAGNFGAEDDEDEFSKAVNAPIDVQDVQDVHDVTDTQLDASLVDTPGLTKEEPVIDDGDVAVNLIKESPSKEETTGEAELATATSSTVLMSDEPHIATDIDIPVSTTRPVSQDPAATSGSTFLAASHEGSLMIWDRRQQTPIARIPSRAGGPWCMDACWAPDGNSFFAGRRNNTVEEYSIHKGLKEPSRILKFPAGSGPVTAVKAMPNGRHLICASFDILRLYDLQNPAAGLPAAITKGMGIPFTIVPGPPRPGVISALHIDPQCNYMLSAAGNRGWEGMSTESLVGYEIACLP